MYSESEYLEPMENYEELDFYVPAFRCIQKCTKYSNLKIQRFNKIFNPQIKSYQQNLLQLHENN